MKVIGLTGVAPDADLVVKMSAGRPARIPHITDPVATRYPLSHIHADLRHMAVKRFDSEFVMDLYQHDHSHSSSLPQ